MLIFVDLTEAYWGGDAENRRAHPTCAFLSTVGDTFVDNDGAHTFDSLEEVEMALGARGVALVPPGFFDGARSK